ncbi:MAG: 30S ribosomal protein S6 [Bryobacteraceae bacterium]|nr:30S ribosomal protein S6 [Bryobacteraceae bacterium]
MRIYEELFIVDPNASDEDIEAVANQVQAVVTDGGGTVDKVDKWGVRRLAYRVKKRDEGFYILVQFSAGPDVVKEIERRLRVHDLVLKYITVRIDEKLQWLDKRKKAREKRALKKPAPVPVGAPGPKMPGEPVEAESSGQEEQA